VNFLRLGHIAILSMFFALGIAACASSRPDLKTSLTEDKAIADLHVMDLSDKTEIVVQGNQPIHYTFLMLDDPPRVVVNLMAMTRGDFGPTIKVDKGVVRQIALHEGPHARPDVQMEILLNQNMKPEIRAENNSLLIDFDRPQIDGDRVVDEYRIGPEDVLEIMVWKNSDLTRTVTVRPDGKVSLPLIGDVQASGLTPDQLKAVVTKRMKEYISAPEVSVLVSNINSYFYYILGEVIKPGKYPLKERTTVLQAISMAGGFTPFASKNGISLFRKDPLTYNDVKYRIRYDDIISSTDPKKNLVIQSGDTLVVP